MAMPAASARRAISPYAKRLARERGIAIEQLAGSGPSGRVTAADVIAFVPRATAAPVLAIEPQASALGATISIAKLRDVLDNFAKAAMPFSLDDAVLRAAGCALDDVPAANAIGGAPVALEYDRRQLVFADLRKGSLGPARARRLAAIEAGVDQSSEPATLSVKLIEAGDIRPVMLPLQPGRTLRLVLAAGRETGECLLAFDAARVDMDAAADLLTRFKAYLEEPLRLLV
jgi:pyruvate dehydrogenase E2 component (dihydrolipoamide acetyltransferase)